MKKTYTIVILIITALMITTIMYGCKTGNEVVIYTSVDRNFSEPVLKEFEKQTGIKIKPVYDVEAAKTTGLVNRIIAEKGKPRADVFWNGEIAQTMRLKEEDTLTPYISNEADKLPANFKHSEGYWTAFGGRARVIILNTDLIKGMEKPDSVHDFFNPEYPAEKTAVAKPLFGTTATQAAALYALWGDDKGYDFYKRLDERNIMILDGNSVVRDYVADGKLLFGLTDTDDALGALEKGKPVEIIFPDQGEEDIGTLIIPNTIALVKGGPNPDNGRKFIDYILKKGTMKELIESGWCQVTVRDIDTKSPVPVKNIKTMNVEWEQVFKKMDLINKELKELFMD